MVLKVPKTFPNMSKKYPELERERLATGHAGQRIGIRAQTIYKVNYYLTRNIFSNSSARQLTKSTAPSTNTITVTTSNNNERLTSTKSKSNFNFICVTFAFSCAVLSPAVIIKTVNNS